MFSISILQYSNGHLSSSKQQQQQQGANVTAAAPSGQSNPSSNNSEMDVSSPFADVKQISVQNNPLGGKVNAIFC